MTEIPYPAPPKIEQINPLQTLEKMQGLALQGAQAQKAQQDAALQAKQMRADQMFGNLLQQSINPETGQPDMDKAIAIAAQHPETAYRYPQYLEAAATLGGLNADRHKKELEYNAKALEVAYNSFLPLTEKLQNSNNPVTKSDVMGVFGSMRVSMPKETVDKLMYDYLDKEAKGLTNPASYVRGSIMQTKQGLDALQASQGTFAERNREVIDPATKMPMPYLDYLSKYGQGGPRGFAAMEGNRPQQETVSGGVAPSSPTQPGGSERPSAPAPASSGPSPAMLGEAQKEFYGNQAKDFAEKSKEVAERASMAAENQMQITEIKKLMPNISDQLGQLAKEGLTISKIAQYFDKNDDVGVIGQVLGESDPTKQKKIIASLEQFEKMVLMFNTEAAKASIGSRIAVSEFNKFNDALLNLRTTGQGAKQIIDYMEKINKMLELKNEYMQEYRNGMAGTKYQFDMNAFQRNWEKVLEKHPELYKFDEEK